MTMYGFEKPLPIWIAHGLGLFAFWTGVGIVGAMIVQG
jgi:hypothetical protein